MLKFIIGISGTGKTHNIMHEIKQRAKLEKNSILIVPEQFSQTSETMLYNTLKDGFLSYANVYSFTSFAEFILEKFGGTAIGTISDAQRVVLVRQAALSLGDKLKLYYNQRKNTGFCAMCAQIINEFKTAGASVDDLLSISDNNEKIKEIALIYAAYEGLIKNIAIDPQDRITLATQYLDIGFFEDIEFYIDGFDGFTAPQYKMLELIMQNSDCTVSLCADTLFENEGGFGLFSSVKKAAARLIRIAKRRNIAVKAPEVLNVDYRHKNSEILSNLNLFFCNAENTFENINCENNDEFTLNYEKNIYEECKTAAVQIAQLVSKGEKYNDIAIICRESDKYILPLKHELNLMNIPYFTDEVSTVENTAVATFLRCALQIAYKGIQSENILRLIKTGVGGFDTQDIMALENYIYTWQPSADDWAVPFDKNPSGFGDSSNLSAEDKEILNKAENLRFIIYPKIMKFNDKIGKFANDETTALQISKALYNLLLSFDAQKHVLSTANFLGLEKTNLIEQNDNAFIKQVNLGENIYRAYNIIIGLLDKMHELFLNERITTKEYDEIFALLLASHDVGHIPQTDNCIIITTADRMRLQNPKYCFVFGVSEGEFPKTVGFSGLLTHADRQELVQIGIEMPGGYENRVLLENMFFYKAIFSSSHGLYLSTLAQEYGGAPLCSALVEMCAKFEPKALFHTVKQKSFTELSAIDYFSTNYRIDNEITATIDIALSKQEKTAEILKLMQKANVKKHFTVEKLDELKKLIGKEMTISPTRIEQFNKCHFAYFVQYVLKIKPLQKAELSPLESGNFVHYVLEHVLKITSKDFVNLSNDEIQSISSKIADDYVKEFMPSNSERFKYLINRLKENILNLLIYLQEEQKQSLFVPFALEQEIGFGENAVAPLRITTQEGEIVNVIGKIDRVDMMQTNEGNYLRVIDYKTGKKDFKLEEVYCGLNAQMLFYMFTLCKTDNEMYKGTKPAGVLYIIADKAPKSTSRHDANMPISYERDGIIIDNMHIIKGMDKELKGKYVPISFKINGEPNARSLKKLASVEKLENIEKHLNNIVIEMAKQLYQGKIEAIPLRDSAKSPCDYCDYRPICGHEDGIDEKMISAPDNLFN